MPEQRPVTLFALATLTPVPLLLAGAIAGGWWIALALLFLTTVTFTLDRLIAHAAPNAPEGAEFPAANGLSVTLALAHFSLMVAGVAALSGTTGLSPLARVAAFFAFGLFFGQVSNANAHELIHRNTRPLRLLGTWVYISMLFGHHASAHPRVHHRYVATPKDPNSARLGESFYSFAPRAWIGSFREGLRAEQALRNGGRTPYPTYVAGGIGLLVLSALAFGLPGLIAHLALAGYGTAQLLMSDYVQHYGLTRAELSPGKYEPTGSRHSWDAPHWFSGYLMLNAPRHSDHHAHPARIYPALRLAGAEPGPTLPYSLPVMATLALLPRRWHRMMDKRAAGWHPQSAG